MLLLVNENFLYVWQHTEHDQQHCNFCLVATYKPLRVFTYKHEGTISESKKGVPVHFFGFIILVRVTSNLPKPQVEIFAQQKLDSGHKIFSHGL